jgi:predicted peptidase
MFESEIISLERSMRSLYIVLVLLLVVLLVGCGTAPSDPELLRRPYQSSATGMEREYLLHLPAGYQNDPARLWPVILFLHGAGERGDGLDDLDFVMRHGPLMEVWIQKRDLGFIVIGPQMPVFEQKDQLRFREGVPKPERLETGVPQREPESRTDRPIVRTEETQPHHWDETGPPEGWWKCEDDVLAILDEVLQDFRADPDRIYLTGISYGGYGTFYMASAHPHRWAAIAPIVGTGDPETATTLAEHNLPIWMFGGGRDESVRVGWLYEMAQALEAAGHRSLRFTVHEDTGHDAWKRVYSGNDLYDWFLTHSRPRPDQSR